MVLFCSEIVIKQLCAHSGRVRAWQFSDVPKVFISRNNCSLNGFSKLFFYNLVGGKWRSANKRKFWWNYVWRWGWFELEYIWVFYNDNNTSAPNRFTFAGKNATNIGQICLSLSLIASTGLLECCLCPLFLECQDPLWKWIRNSQ